jgi:hypothetical protein
MEDLRNFGSIRLKWTSKTYTVSVGWSKVCQDRFGTECRATNKQQQYRPRTLNVTPLLHYDKSNWYYISCVCVSVALDTQRKMRMRCIIVSSVACSALL